MKKYTLEDLAVKPAPTRVVEMIGKKYGLWTVNSFAGYHVTHTPSRKHIKVMVSCTCGCGQGSNKRNNKTFVYRGVRYTLAEAVRAFGIPRGTLIYRHRIGLSGEDIVNQPRILGARLPCKCK